MICSSFCAGNNGMCKKVPDCNLCNWDEPLVWYSISFTIKPLATEKVTFLIERYENLFQQCEIRYENLVLFPFY